MLQYSKQNVCIFRTEFFLLKGVDYMALEVRVRKLAHEKGFRNAAQLQKATGLTYPQVSRLWAEGYMESVSLRALAAVAKALGVSAKDLLVETEDEQEAA
jgi:DNA-binding Xre family transcriptional regulator